MNMSDVKAALVLTFLTYGMIVSRIPLAPLPYHPTTIIMDVSYR
jgi:hypothetical protein